MSLQGIVDSDTLPLNVSREMLQQHSSLKTIKKKLVRKALDMIRRIVEEDQDENIDTKEIGQLAWWLSFSRFQFQVAVVYYSFYSGYDLSHVTLSHADDDQEDKRIEVFGRKGKYAKFWKEYGKAIKLGIIEDTSNRVRLAKLLRFYRWFFWYDYDTAACALLPC